MEKWSGGGLVLYFQRIIWFENGFEKITVIILSTCNAFWKWIKSRQHIKDNANVNANKKMSGKENKTIFNWIRK